MDYLKGILSGLGAIILAEILPGAWWLLRNASRSKPTGIAALWGSLLGSLFSPLFWALAILFFALFFWAGRSGNKPLRILVFWIPTLAATAFTAAYAALLTFLILHFRNR